MHFIITENYIKALVGSLRETFYVKVSFFSLFYEQLFFTYLLTDFDEFQVRCT